jgi:PAT family beta-lactamase induction signal transducer AmpG
MVAAMKSWRESIAVYADRRILVVLLLGFSSGLPLALTGSTLSVWLTEDGVSLAAVGLFAMVGVPYSFKFLWAPLVDRAPVPLMTRLFGRRRGWALTTQGALIVALLALGASDPTGDPWTVAALALVVAFCSASQDIVIDAYRVEILEESQYGAGAAAVQFGYRAAMLVSGAGALLLAEVLAWFWVYAVMAGLVGLGAVVILACREPDVPVQAAKPATRGVVAWMRDAFVGPFADMLRRHGWTVAVILAFVVLYKLGDAMAGVMANPFYIKIGFTKADIAEISKLYGFIATIAGTAMGGVLVARIGIARSLLVCGVLQAASNLMFAWQAYVGADRLWLTATIAIENVSGGMGSAAFVAYISALCSLAYTGTQYALLSSVAALGRTVLAAQGGYLVEAVGWIDFFLLSTVAALPGLALLLWMMRRFPPERAAEAAAD